MVSQQSMQLVTKRERERERERDHCGGLCSPNEAGSEWRRMVRREEERLTNSNRL